MYKKAAAKWLVAALASALVLTACGREEKNGAEGSQGAEITSGPAGTPAGGEDKNTPTGAEGDISGENDKKQAPEVSWEILRDARTDASGKEIAFAEYPEFSLSGDGFEALASALAQINGEWREQSTQFLDSVVQNPVLPDSGAFAQTVNITVTRCDAEAVSLSILRTEEEGGPHPNNYSDVYNFSTQTGERLELSDVVETGGDFRLKLKEQLIENYPDLEFDDALLDQGIADALDQKSLYWSFREGGVSIGFPVGSFGFGYAEGSLGVWIPLQ